MLDRDEIDALFPPDLPGPSVEFYINAGYLAPSVLYYLRGLINGRLAEMPLDEALRTPLRLSLDTRRSRGARRIEAVLAPDRRDPRAQGDSAALRIEPPGVRSAR